MNQSKLSKRELQKLIWLAGAPGPGYMVMVSGFDGMLPIAATSATTGHAIVRAMRGLAMQHPDYFPYGARNWKPCGHCGKTVSPYVPHNAIQPDGFFAKCQGSIEANA